MAASLLQCTNFLDDGGNEKMSLMEENEDFSICNVCRSEYNSDKRIAKFLPCFHTFCLECLRSLSSLTVIITCPKCRKTFTCNNGVDNLPSNLYALHIAEMSHKAERTKQLQTLEYWCTVCESVANLSCYFSNPRHCLVPLRGSSVNEAEDLQRLIKGLPLKKSLAVQKRKHVQAHLNLLMQSIKQIEAELKEQMVKNDLQLARLVSLDVDGDFGLSVENKELTISIAKETISRLTLQCEESLNDISKITENLDLQKRIRILLSFRSTENQTIPTCSLFEDGFYCNWPTSENLSSTDRNLLLVSHLIFSILKRWNIPLQVKSPSTSLYSVAAMTSTEDRQPVASASTTMSSCVSNVPAIGGSFNTSEPSFDNTPTNSNNKIWGSASMLSYSQVLNLPKPAHPQKQQHQASCERLPTFTFRFGQKGNGKFNLSSKFLGDVSVKVTLSSHVTFVQELVNFCHKPREFTRRITKASPGMFITLQVENPLMLEAIPSMQSLGAWERHERTKDAWDIGINSVLDADGHVIAWKLIFLLEKFKPNNMEVAMLFGKVTEGKEVLQQMASRTKQDRFNLQVTVKLA